jgi:hypothetical protein
MTFSHSVLTSALAAALLTAGVSDTPLSAATPQPSPPPAPGASAVTLPALPLLNTPTLRPEVAPDLLGLRSAPAPQDSPSKEAPSATAAGAAEYPADLLDLSNWSLTLPVGDPGDPEDVTPPKLPKFANEFFRVNKSRDGVIFTANVGGTTTKNSKYPRSELREMQGEEKAAWSNTSGTHTLSVREAILAVPPVKPEVVAAQIHDGGDDVMQIRLEGRRLVVQYDDGGSETVLDPDYKLGTVYDVQIVAKDGRVDVIHNGVKKAELPKSGSGWYFKVGAYVQSNPEKGDKVGAPGTVALYSLQATHSG